MKYYYYIIDGPEEQITEVSLDKFDEILSNARDGFYRKSWMHGKTPCKFVVHTSPQQEVNGVEFEASKTIVLIRKN